MTDDRRPAGPPEDPEDAATRRELRLDTFRRHLYTGADLDKIPPPVPVVDGWIYENSLAWLFGSAGHCKSYVALDWAGCVANGLDWHGFATKQAPVLYIALEGGPGLAARRRAWEEHCDHDIGARFLVPSDPLDIVSDAEVLATLALEMDAGLIILDTQNRATIGLEENSSGDMGRMIAGMEIVRRETGACLVVLHHTAARSEGEARPRGHSSIDAAATSMIRVAKDGPIVKVENRKQKDEQRTKSLVLALTPSAGGAVLAHGQSADQLPLTESQEKILAALADIAAIKPKVLHSDLKSNAKARGVSESTFSWSLKKLVERHLVGKDGNSYIALDAPQLELH